MALFNDPTFMVYTKGYHPKQLCLGHLVLGDWYHMPVEQVSRSCKGRLLDESELARWTLSTDWKGKIIAKKGGRAGFGVELFEIAHLQPNVELSDCNVLEAEKGRRIELENPQKFLEEMVYSNPDAKAKLQKWLSIARTDYMFKRFFGVKPKIWMLTALYQLEGVKSSIVEDKGISIDTGVGSALVGALSGVPVGASVGLGSSSGSETNSTRLEPQVYAGRWQLLEAEYIRLRSDNPPNMLALHRDNIYSAGYAMEEGKAEDNKAHNADTVKLECISSKDQEFHSSDGMDAEYWKEFDKVERKLARRGG